MSTALFDRKLLRTVRQRASALPGNFDFLISHTTIELGQRLNDITSEFPLCLYIGQGEIEGTDKTGRITHCDYGRTADIEADDEHLPFAPETFNLCISNLNLHSVNDMPVTLLQIKNCLKPDGLFMASLFGGKTLWQLKESLRKAYTFLNKKDNPRVFPFADKEQMAGLMVRSGFAMPVVDSEVITVTYNSVFDLFHDLRGMGEGNILNARSRNYPGREFFSETANIYKRDYSGSEGRITADFEVIYLAGWQQANDTPVR